MLKLPVNEFDGLNKMKKKSKITHNLAKLTTVKEQKIYKALDRLKKFIVKNKVSKLPVGTDGFNGKNLPIS